MRSQGAKSIFVKILSHTQLTLEYILMYVPIVDELQFTFKYSVSLQHNSTSVYINVHRNESFTGL